MNVGSVNAYDLQSVKTRRNRGCNGQGSRQGDILNRAAKSSKGALGPLSRSSQIAADESAKRLIDYPFGPSVGYISSFSKTRVYAN